RSAVARRGVSPRDPHRRAVGCRAPGQSDALAHWLITPAEHPVDSDVPERPDRNVCTIVTMLSSNIFRIYVGAIIGAVRHPVICQPFSRPFLIARAPGVGVLVLIAITGDSKAAFCLAPRSAPQIA